MARCERHKNVMHLHGAPPPVKKKKNAPMATGKPALAQSSAVLELEKWGPATDDAEHTTRS